MFFDYLTGAIEKDDPVACAIPYPIYLCQVNDLKVCVYPVEINGCPPMIVNTKCVDSLVFWYSPP